MLGVNKGTGLPLLLCFCDHLQCQSCLTGAFRSIDLNNPAIWQTTNAQSNIQTERTGRDRRQHFPGLLTHAHNRAFTELPFDLRLGCAENLLFILFHLIPLWCVAIMEPEDFPPPQTTVYINSIQAKRNVSWVKFK